MYIDDGIVASKSESQCCEHRDMVVSDLERAGFVLNVNKCCLEPCQTGKWLGFIVDLSEGEISCSSMQARQAQSLSMVNFTAFQSSSVHISKCCWPNRLYEPCNGPNYQIEDESFVCCS